MIWNDEDIEDIAKNKFSIQSSISKYSIQNANINLLKDDFPIGEHAFHTAKEDNPWCIIDLEQSYPIEHIRVYNIRDIKYRERTKSLYVEISHNGIDWIKVSSELCSWEDKYFIFNAVLSQVYSARYVKLSLGERNYFHLSKVQVFTRKIPGYIISAKPDGFGMKLYSILAGIFLAKKTGMKFKFTWFTPADSLNNPEQCLGISFGNIEEVFSSEFISQYYISNSLVEKNHGFFIHSKKRTIKEILNGPCEKKWGWYAPGIEGGLLSEWIEDIGYSECIIELKRIYDTILFSDKFEYIRKRSVIDAQKYGNFVALHIRGADIIYSEHYSRFSLYGFVGDKFFPYEIAIEIALCEIKKGNKIIIFGQDILMNNNLAQYVSEITEKKDIVTIDSFLEKYNFNDFERSFYEMNFMSKAQMIYTPGISKQKSAFSYCSMIISGSNNAISFHDLYSKEEQFEIVLKRINKFEINNKYKSFSYLRLYLLSMDLDCKAEESIGYIQKAYDCNPENESFVILIVKMYFLMRQYDKAEEYLKEAINKNEDRFFKTLFIHHARVYKNEFLTYKENASSKYPHISYVAAKICQYENKIHEALGYCENSLSISNGCKMFQILKANIKEI
ncbi:discoidin domain-containing protein [Campylobacter lari]|uniref:discoidin domain-containing protein n=1 Tax=Campylobacter lari TaxID=201 RepID=UPI001570BF85|nr:discoidin domain-containing protein [Campylobacter lari]